MPPGRQNHPKCRTAILDDQMEFQHSRPFLVSLRPSHTLCSSPATVLTTPSPEASSCFTAALTPVVYLCPLTPDKQRSSSSALSPLETSKNELTCRWPTSLSSSSPTFLPRPWAKRHSRH